ncbi:transcription termination factor MTEF18, mitochondrial-like [Gastrolobium bilobum]|uniref:transcription termination factor MTEF18, mitochondrial-like n=1 Tax=Gastrolobium bilobum TaxID=150636 RepID=UPI002AB2FE62|nr:transcription termination factor MTEF18, mitochondrial-like [Gastrolobium bilobum]
MIIHFRKLRLTSTLSNVARNNLNLKPSENPRFQNTKRALQSDAKLPRKAIMKEAQAALLEYLHSTRSLQFLDADNMCKNSPFFLQDLLRKIQKNHDDGDMKRSISRYLRYHPINEFEPFFESVGLKPSEYAPLLPRGMIFLNDDHLLMDNYHTLCNYGVPRSKMGKIFNDAPQVFRYDNRVLQSKLEAYEKLGVASSILVKAIASSPFLLVGDVNLGFVKVVEKLKHLVVAKDDSWIEGHLLDGVSFNWGMMLELLSLLGKVYRKGQLADLISRHPCVVFEDSGGRTLSLIGFLFKFGLSLNQISLIFLELPQIQIGKFFSNLRHCFLFLSEIEMQAAEIGRIFQSHSLLLGSSTLKKTTSLLGNLNVGKKRLCRIIQDNPQEMKNWVLGKKLQPLENSNEEQESKMLKTEFLLSLGYVENSKNMEEAFKLFRGKGAELQERFDFFVKAGFDCEDVRKMIRVAPQILNQTTDRINMKIEYLVNEGYPISTLVSFPSFLSYTPQRVKLRLSMYNWLQDHGAADPGLALSTLIACSEKIFVSQYVKRHPSGPKVWKDLKTEIYSED